jgi:hypothetical protein
VLALRRSEMWSADLQHRNALFVFVFLLPQMRLDFYRYGISRYGPGVVPTGMKPSIMLSCTNTIFSCSFPNSWIETCWIQSELTTTSRTIAPTPSPTTIPGQQQTTPSPVTPDPGSVPFCADVQFSTTTAGTFTHTCRVTGPVYSQSKRDNVASITFVGNGIGGSFAAGVTPSGTTSCIGGCYLVSTVGTWSALATKSIDRATYFDTLVDYRVVVTSPSTSGSISFTPNVVETITASANCSAFFCNGGSCAWSRMCTAGGVSLPLSPYCSGLSAGTSSCPQSTSTCCPSTAAAPCFHKDTVITYGKAEFSGLAEISSLADCSVPHVVRSVGVIVKAQCSSKEHNLRLTAGHLIFTQRGLQAAIDLKPGVDTIYADLEETAKCTVAQRDQRDATARVLSA